MAAALPPYDVGCSKIMELPESSPSPPKPFGVWHKVASAVIAVLLIYLAVAYLVLPDAWKRYTRHHPSLDGDPRITETSDGHPGDPLNVGLIGTEAQINMVMRAANWYPADPLGMRSDLKIGVDTVLKRSYDKAPVSSLYLYGRKEDLAFEQPVGDNPRERHHVRFWRSVKKDSDGRPMWLGSATYDKRVGLSHTTGQITHHIAPDIDTERNHLAIDLEQTSELAETYSEKGFHKTLEGRNGGGDPWHTDGDLWVGIVINQ